MAERAGIHLDVAGYALGELAGGEHARFEQHLAECAACRGELAELEGAARMLSFAAPADRPPASLAARTLLAVEREAGTPAAPTAFARPRRRRVFALAAVAAVGVAVVVAQLARDPGTLELDATLRSPSQPGVTGTVRVTETGIGRVVEVESEDLPVLDNEREFYELWFVARGDAPGSPDRVSAGTFHPDESGRTSVRLAAAVVPAEYPAVIVTREPRDGDPRPGGPVVLRGP
jgi:anti-sigma-K factor RskA